MRDATNQPLSSLCSVCDHVLRHCASFRGKSHYEIAATTQSLSERASQGCQLCEFLLNGHVAQTQQAEASKEVDKDHVERYAVYWDYADPSLDDTERCLEEYSFQRQEERDRILIVEKEPKPGVKEIYYEFQPPTPMLELSMIPFNNFDLWASSLNHGITFVPACEVKSILNPRVVGASTESLECWNGAMTWLNGCTSCHKSCNILDAKIRTLPSRLIELSDGEAFRQRLCASSQLSPTTKYTTLSHCWGQHMPLRLLRKNLPSLETGIPWEQLSKTFQDTLTVTRRLGIRHVWIDSLCIIQDSKDDWIRESAVMSQIYSNSTLNIAATAARDGRDGLFFSRDPIYLKPITVHIGQPQELYYGFSEGLFIDGLDQAPLTKRAWVHQERLLCPRTLHFSGQQLFWECRELSACETFPLGSPESVRGLRIAPRSVIEDGYAEIEHIRSNQSLVNCWKWMRTVEDYSRQRLTYPEDVLPAIGGIASELQSITNDAYLAGIWRSHLDVGLLWHVEWPGQPAKFSAPTWSWTSSVNGTGRGVYWNIDLAGCEQSTKLVRILNVEVELSSSNQFGSVRSGSLCLQGQLAKAQHKIGDRSIKLLSYGANSVEFCSWSPDICMSLPGKPTGNFMNDLYCLPVLKNGQNRITGLVLRPSQEVYGKFCRFGVFDNWGGNASLLTEACEYFDSRAEEWGLKYHHDEERGNLYEITII